MATNNAINLKNSGIVSYDGAGTFSALANPLIVANGGSGVASFTAYSVLCGGTTGTGAFQNVSGVGSSTNVLTGTGTSSLPIWQAYKFPMSIAYYGRNSVANPADGTTYYLGYNTTSTAFTASNGNTRFYMVTTGTITKFYAVFTVTVGSSQNVTVALRLNNTSNTTVATVTFDAATITISNTSVNLNVVAGDFIDVIIICPTWTSDPTNLQTNFSFLVS